jgi:chromosome segregation ATPase
LAENTNYIGVAMGLDVTDLKAGLSEANKQIQLANSQFKAAASGMDDWTKSTEGLNAKVKQLDTVLKAQKAKLAGITAEYEKAVREQGENSEAARKLAIQMNNQQAVVNKTERELNNYKETLEQVEDGTIDLAEVTLKNGKAMEKGGKAVKDAGDEAEDAEKKFGGLKAGIAAIGAAIVGAVAGFLSLAESTRESRNEMAKLETSFQTAGLSAENAEKTFTDLYGIMGDEGAAVEAAQQLAKISKGEKDLAANTRILTGVMAEYGNSIPLEGLAEGIAASSSMSSVQGVLADALEWQGVNLDDYNAKLETLATEEERSAYIQKTLTDLYGESADAYRENNAEVIAAQEAQANLNSVMNELGATAEPIMTALKQGFAEVLKAVKDLLAGADFESIKTSIEGGFSTFIEDILPKIVDGFKWIIDNKDALIAGIAGIGTAFAVMNVANMIMGVVKAFKAFKLAQEGATVAQ